MEHHSTVSQCTRACGEREESQMGVVEKMEQLARKYHAGQFRKDGKTPYIEHPAAVVARLRSWGIGNSDSEADAVSLAVAWGHDLLEDTAISEEEILGVGAFGEKILAGIKMLTFAKPEEGCTQAQRDLKKAEYIKEVAQTASPEILAVKIADRLCNTEDFLSGWGKRKALVYLYKGAELINAIHRLDSFDNGKCFHSPIRETCTKDFLSVLSRLLDDVEDNVSLISYFRSMGLSEDEIRNQVQNEIRFCVSRVRSGSLYNVTLYARWDLEVAMNLQRIDLFEMAIANGADLFYYGYDGERIVHDILDASLFGREEGGNVEFARKALRLIVDMGYEGLLDSADDDGFTPLYLNRHNPKAVALFGEFGIKKIERLPPMPWKADD